MAVKLVKFAGLSFLLAPLFFLGSCQEDPERLSFLDLEISPDTLYDQANKYRLDRKGRIIGAPELPEPYTLQNLDTLPFPPLDSITRQALRNQLKVLDTYRQKPQQKLANLSIQLDQYRTVIRILLDYGHNPLLLQDKLVAYQTWGKDRRGHVRFTGYYTPVLKVRTQPDSVYRYPFYRNPGSWEGPWPTRAEIMTGHALQGKELEIAYAADPLDVYYTQLQGSAVVEFEDTGQRRRLTYDGSNKHPYVSIERFLARQDQWKIGDVSMDGIRRFLRQHPELTDTLMAVNPSYTFFNLKRGPVLGAGQVPMIPGVSVAVDRRYFPLGSILLATVPCYDRYGEIERHEFRLLMPQDVGGVIKGPGHIDLYEGVGAEGKQKAWKRYHYGRVWMLLPQPLLPAH